MTDNIPTIDTGAASTASPDTSAIVSDLDAQIDEFFKEEIEPLTKAAAKAPEKAKEVDDDVLEDSGARDASEGDSDTDALDAAETDESEPEDTSDIVDWEEMKDFSYQINGKTYTANDLKSALGRQTKQQQDRTEVETARKEVEAERSKVAGLTQSLKKRQELIQHEAKLTSFGNHIQNLERQREAARQAGNVAAYTQLGMQVEPMIKQYHQSRKNIDDASAKNTNDNLSIQKTILEDKGYGDVLADTQRRNALSDYISSTYSDTALGQVTMDAELIILAEKARLYDKAHSSSKAKLKGSGKTLKGGATKSRSRNKQPVDKIQSQIDEMFKDYL